MGKIKVGVYYRNTNPQVELENVIKDLAEKYGMVYDTKKPDYLFYIGGDGTFLRAVHNYLEEIDHMSFVGIKAGTLGFFYQFNKEDVEEVIKLIASKEYKEDAFNLIEGSVYFNDGTVKNVFAVNEVRIESPFKTLICDVEIDDEHLEKFRGNGLNVCTNLGSSGYNKSLGGALIHHKLDVVELSEIAPISNNIYRSIGSSMVFSKETKITFKGDFSTMRLGFDFSSFDIGEASRLEVKLSNKKIKLIQSKDYSYISLIKRSFIK